MSDYQEEIPDMEKINTTPVGWTNVTKEGNKLCQSLNKLIKAKQNDENFKNEFIIATNDLLDKVFDVINNKVPGLGEYLELKNLEHLQRPDWSRAMLLNDEIRMPLRNPDHLKEQLTDMEKKLQQILARIPSTEDFTKEMRIQFQKGAMGCEDEFVRVQNGLLGVTRRVDEIEDFREVWKNHKDTIISMIKRKNIPFNARPADIASMRFYQFINLPIGQSCYKLITLNGWPTTENWKKWEAWWNIQIQRVADHENHRGVKSQTSTWHMQVSHTTSMIMQAVQDINIAAASNLAQIQLEPLIWKLAFIKNALTEIFIIPIQGETGWFADLWEITQKITQKTPTLEQLQKMLVKLVPAKIPEDHIMHVSTPYKDLLPIRDFKYEVATSEIPVPRIRSIEDNYRLKLDSGNKIKPETSEEKPKKRKLKTTRETPKRVKEKTVKKQPSKRRKRKSSSEHEIEVKSESENDIDDSSSEDETSNKEAIILGSSSSEDEDFI